MLKLSGCKINSFGNIFQISCVIQKIYLILQPIKNNFPIRAFLEPPNRIKFQDMAEILDETDLQILKTLQKNAKLTTKELADAVH